jgi:hypothetical protein
VEKFWQRKIDNLETRLNRQDRNDVNSLTQQEVARCHKRLDEDAATFDRMKAAFTKMSERIATVEARAATPTITGE